MEFAELFGHSLHHKTQLGEKACQVLDYEIREFYDICCKPSNYPCQVPESIVFQDMCTGTILQSTIRSDFDMIYDASDSSV